jgi:UDP-GlcNAc3NAcA epimerase
VTIIGARPQFIKAATVSRQLKFTSLTQEVLVHTGQHYDDNMSEIFFRELEIPRPEYNLGIGSGSHGAQTGRMLEAIEEVLLKIAPDVVLVYGDTNSTLAGALAAVKLHIPLAHVEAGLRSYDRNMPEEINRVLTDHAADVLFAPTLAAAENLSREGLAANRIRLVGDVMYDAALYYGARAERESRILEKLRLAPNEYLLATIHRAENADSSPRLRAIFEGLLMLTKAMPVVVPLHPRTRAALQREGLLSQVSQWTSLIEPVGYLDMAMLEKHAKLIATDSGGVQREAFFYRVPCATLRNETEWIELVNSGWNRIVPPLSAAKVYEDIRGALGQCGSSASPYGDGHAARKITDLLANWRTSSALAAAV